MLSQLASRHRAVLVKHLKHIFSCTFFKWLVTQNMNSWQPFGPGWYRFTGVESRQYGFGITSDRFRFGSTIFLKPTVGLSDLETVGRDVERLRGIDASEERVRSGELGHGLPGSGNFGSWLYCSRLV